LHFGAFDWIFNQRLMGFISETAITKQVD